MSYLSRWADLGERRFCAVGFLVYANVVLVYDSWIYGSECAHVLIWLLMHVLLFPSKQPFYRVAVVLGNEKQTSYMVSQFGGMPI